LRKFSIGIVGVLIASSVLFSPYTLGLNNHQVSAKDSKNDLLFITKDNLDKQEKHLKSKQEKNELGISFAEKHVDLKVQKKIDSSSEEIENYDEIAFPVEDVRNDKKLQKDLKKLMKNGTKVYLYGGLTLEEYTRLLDIEKLTTSKKGKKYVISDPDPDTDDLQDKGIKDQPKKPRDIGEQDDGLYEVVGYSLQEDAINKVVISNITSYNENKEVAPTTDEMFLEIVDAANLTGEIQVEEQQAEKLAHFGVFKQNKALAERKTRKSAPDWIYGSAYYNGMRVGYTYTDWVIQQELSESDSTYDYFNIFDTTTFRTDSGWEGYKWTVDHDLPHYTVDRLSDFSPKDDWFSPYTVSIGSPWNIGYSFSMSGGPDIDEASNRELGYARWYITGDLYNHTFEPAMAWKSTGTLAEMDIRHWGYFSKRTLRASSFIKINVKYDYTYKNI
jgi:hypothetical protein